MTGGRRQTKIVRPAGYRRFDSRWGWNRPEDALGWRAYTLTLRLVILAVLVWSLFGCPVPW